MKELTAAGGVLFREVGGGDIPQVLLIYRRGVWDLPKGKLEKGESVSECARREVSEEVGCKLPLLHSRLKDTYHEYRENDKLIGKTTHWYAMTLTVSDENLKPERKEGIEKLEWISLREAEQQVGYENLREVLRSFAKWRASDK